MRIVHLSDLHLNHDTLRETNYCIISKIINDLEEFNQEKKIDIITVTGDLIDKGGISFDQNIDIAFKKFEEKIIEPIRCKLNLSKEQFIFTPGNHDVDPNKESIDTNTGVKMRLNNTKEVSKVIRNNMSTKFMDEKVPTEIKTTLAFKKFEKEFHANSNAEITNFQSCYKYKIGELTIGVAAFNTAWTCFFIHDKEHNEYINEDIILGVYQTICANDYLTDCDVKIALMHHEINSIQDFELEEVESMIRNEYNILLCGHTHKGSAHKQYSSSEEIYISTAPANTADNVWENSIKYINGYSIIDYDISNENINVHYRIYSKNQNKYIYNSHKGNNGIETFTLKRKRKTYGDNTQFDIKEDNTTRKEMQPDLIFSDTRILKAYDLDKDIVIGNKKTSLPFFENKELFGKYINELCKNSRYYKDLQEDITFISVIIDRLLYNFALEDSCQEYIQTICELNKLDDIQNEQKNRIEFLNKIFKIIEWWIEKLFNLLEYENISQNLDDNIKHIINTYKINTQEEIFGETLQESIETYNLLNDNKSLKIAKKSNFALMNEILICFIFVVHLQKDLIADKTREYLVGSIENENIKLLVESTKSEYKEYLNYFRGRINEIEEVTQCLTINHYTILKGEHRVGKSALIANVVKNLSNNQYKMDLSSLIIIHSFKQAKSIYEMVKATVEQCNVKLINKIDVSILNKLSEEGKLQDNDDNTGIEKEKLLNSKYQILKRYLNESLERMAKEYGQVFLIIDSIDLIKQYEDKLEILLRDIPKSCNLLLSTGTKFEGINWLINNGQIDDCVISLDNLSRDEIPLISNLPDSNDNKKINDKIYEKTGGKVTTINKLIQHSDYEKGKFILDILENVLEEDNIEVFERDAEHWIKSKCLEEVLLILSVFEPIQPMLLESIQSFLTFRSIDLRMPRIRNELRKVKNQISDLRFSRIKLLNHDFANYVIKRFFSAKDIEDFIYLLFSWQAMDVKSDLAFTCDFIKYMKDSTIISNEKLNNFFEEFVLQYNNTENNKKLFDIGLYLFFETDEDLNWVLKILKQASDMEDSEAKAFLGYIYITGKKVSKDIIQGEKFLREASAMDNVKAKEILSGILFEGKDIKKNICEAIKILNEAIGLGSKRAKLQLANRLIMGDNVDRNVARGQQMVHELVQSDYTEAIRFMANMLWVGIGCQRNVKRALELLRGAITKGDRDAKLDFVEYVLNTHSKEQEYLEESKKYLEELVKDNNINAKRYYAHILIEGECIQKDTEKGIALLQELINADDSQAKFEYAQMLIEGNNIAQDIDGGRQLLYQEIENNNIEAVRYLGNELIHGKYFDQDVNYGIKLLEKAIGLGDLESKQDLALIYTNGEEVSKDVEKGKKLLLEVIEQGRVQAKEYYARVLLSQCQVDRKQKEIAIQMLEEEAFVGRTQAKRILGEMLIEGKEIEQDTDRGIKLLQEAIELGNYGAMRTLGYRMLFGLMIPPSPYKGEQLLKQAIKAGDIPAKTILGYAIILEKTSECDINKGIKLLEENINHDINASRILGIMLIKGKNIKKDKAIGEKLLRDAMRKGDEIAELEIAEMLLDGQFLQKNIDEGREILHRLVEKNYSDAIIELATRLMDGIGFEKDINRGINYLEKLILENNLDAKCEYGYRIINGTDGIQKNIIKGEELLRDTESQGHEKARFILAMLLIDKKIEEKTEKEGIRLLEKAIEYNDDRAMFNLGDLLIEGIKVEQDIRRGVQLIEKSIKGDNNTNKVNYATRLLEGDIIDKNISRGKELLQEALNQGDLRAKFKLARLLIEGELIEPDIEKGLQFLYELNEDGYENAKLYLARKLIYGDKLQKDILKGINLYEDLLVNENLSAIIEYSELLLDGIYLPRNLSKGERLLKYANQKGNMDACYLLAVRYLNEDGLKKQIKKGRQKLKKAVNNSEPRAVLEYGIRLKYGNKLERDEIKGNNYIEMAIKNVADDTNELYNLGVIAYAHKDYELATRLFTQAYKCDNCEAGTSLAYMLRRNEIRGQVELPSICELLEKSILNGSAVALINYALYLVKDSSWEENWKNADSIIRTLNKCALAANWWYNIARKEDDAEGNLVIGWMTRYNLIDDPDKLKYKNRLYKAAKKGWNIPSWMFEDTDLYNKKINKEFLLNIIKTSIEKEKLKLMDSII